MTTETPNQADGAPNGAAGGSAAGTVDDLVREYTNGSKPDKTNVQEVLKRFEPVVAFAQSEMTRKAEESFKKDIDTAISTVKEDEAVKEVSPRVIRGMLEVYGVENPEFVKAFNNRSSDPGGWQKHLTEARASIAQEFKGSGSRVSSDVLAARASVSGQSPQPAAEKHNAVDLFAMNEQQYQRFLASEAAKSR